MLGTIFVLCELVVMAPSTSMGSGLQHHLHVFF